MSLDLNSTDSGPHSATTHKMITDQLFEAWCQVTVLTKTRETFEGIVSGLCNEGRKALEQSSKEQVVCSTGSILVITRRAYCHPVGYRHEVCITACYNYTEAL